MKLIDEIQTLQDELNSMLNEKRPDKNEILQFSEKLDKLIERYYLEKNNTDNT